MKTFHSFRSHKSPGEENPVKVKGGTLQAGCMGGLSGILYTGNNGTNYFFEGVKVGTGDGPTLGGTACQFNGTVYVGNNPNYFTLNMMIHEYGHYLQELEYKSKYGKLLGRIFYAVKVGGYSAYGYLKRISAKDYYKLPTEADANQRGNEYMKDKYGDRAPQAPIA